MVCARKIFVEETSILYYLSNANKDYNDENKSGVYWQR